MLWGWKRMADENINEAVAMADEAVSNQVAEIRQDGRVAAVVQFVPNERNGVARIEVYNKRGQLLAHQQVSLDTDKELASAIGFALYNGFVFGYRACAYKFRHGVIDLMEDRELDPIL